MKKIQISNEEKREKEIKMFCPYCSVQAHSVLLILWENKEEDWKCNKCGKWFNKSV